MKLCILVWAEIIFFTVAGTVVQFRFFTTTMSVTHQHSAVAEAAFTQSQDLAAIEGEPQQLEQ